MKSLINRKHSRQLKIYVFRRIKEIVFEYRNKRKNKNDLLKSKKKDKNTENRMTGFDKLDNECYHGNLCHTLFSFVQFMINPSLFSFVGNLCFLRHLGL